MRRPMAPPLKQQLHIFPLFQALSRVVLWGISLAMGSPARGVYRGVARGGGTLLVSLQLWKKEKNKGVNPNLSKKDPA